MYDQDDVINQEFTEIQGQYYGGIYGQTVYRYREYCDFSGHLLAQGFGLSREAAKKDSEKKTY